MKKNFTIIIVLLVTGLLAIDNIYLRKENESLSLTISQVDDSSVIGGNTLGVMLETESGSNIYAGSTLTSWPSSNTHTYNETNSFCTNGSTLTWDSTSNTVSFTGNNSDKCSLYFDAKPTLANYIISLYTSDGENDLYYFDGEGTYTNAEYEADDGSYRYSGDDPDNYVCFGDDCTDTDNLYRIIGVFDGEVKLIKYDYATSDLLGTDGDYHGTSTFSSTYYIGNNSTAYVYYWNTSIDAVTYINTIETDSPLLLSNRNTIAAGDPIMECTGTDDWSTSQLNLVNLNTNFIKNIGTTWSSKIATHTWIVGGSTYSYMISGDVLDTYTGEIVSPESDSTYDAKIGLMYVSDYEYSGNQTNWTSISSNPGWMYMGAGEWTITPITGSSSAATAMYIGANKSIYFDQVCAYTYNIRPSFYLNSDVIYVSGTGTIDDPFIIN